MFENPLETYDRGSSGFEVTICEHAVNNMIIIIMYFVATALIIIIMLSTLGYVNNFANTSEKHSSDRGRHHHKFIFDIPRLLLAVYRVIVSS